MVRMSKSAKTVMGKKTQTGNDSQGTEARPEEICETKKENCCMRGFWLFSNFIKWPIILLIVPPLLNYASLKQEQEMLLPHDAILYDVGQGQKMMLRCKGSGAPTVLLEAPTGFSSDIWTEVGGVLSAVTRVCIYDRSGIGFSDRPVIKPHITDSEDADNSAQTDHSHTAQEFTVERMSEDLRRLVTESSSQPQPFILVGSELGALVSRFYSHMYDSQINHVILIDPLTSLLFSHDTFMKFWKEEIIYSTQSRQLTGAIGLNRLSYLSGMIELPAFWSDMADNTNITHRQLHLNCHPRHLKSIVDECAGVLDSLQQIKMLSSVKPFPKSLSYTILYRKVFDNQIDHTSDLNELWREGKENMASSLNIPPDQTSMIELESNSTYQSLSGKNMDILRQIIERKVKEYRVGKTS